MQTFSFSFVYHWLLKGNIPFKKKHTIKWRVKFAFESKKEKQIRNSFNKQTECKECYCKRVLQRYYENKGKISDQQKNYYEKNWNNLLQKQNIIYINFIELIRS